MDISESDCAPAPFYGCYILRSVNLKYKNCTYIGFTVNPGRRYMQHNEGRQKGGAYYTDRRKPWQLIMCIYGFPDKFSALRFEWAWQHPSTTRFLKGHGFRVSNSLRRRIEVMLALVNSTAFNRMPLTIHVVNDVVIKWMAKQPLKSPAHIPIRVGTIRLLAPNGRIDDLEFTDGHVSAKTVRESNARRGVDSGASLASGGSACCVCYSVRLVYHASVATDRLQCYICSGAYHVSCAARHIRRDGGLIPLSGNCKKCRGELQWGRLVREARARERSEQRALAGEAYKDAGGPGEEMEDGDVEEEGDDEGDEGDEDDDENEASRGAHENGEDVVPPMRGYSTDLRRASSSMGSPAVSDLNAGSDKVDDADSDDVVFLHELDSLL